MTHVLIAIHLMAVLALIGLVLLQRSDGGALGIGGGGGNFMSSRGAGNVLTRSTAILAGVFFITSIGLTVLARLDAGPADILDRIEGQGAPVGGAPSLPGVPTGGGGVLDALRQQSGGAPAAPTAPAPEAPAPAGSAPAEPAPAAPPAPAPAPGPQAAPEAAAPPAPVPEPAPALAAPAPPAPAPGG